MEQTAYVSNYWHSNIKLILLLAICTTPCGGAYQQCTAPNTCTCMSGWRMNGTECIGIISHMLFTLITLDRY